MVRPLRTNHATASRGVANDVGRLARNASVARVARLLAEPSATSTNATPRRSTSRYDSGRSPTIAAARAAAAPPMLCPTKTSFGVFRSARGVDARVSEDTQKRRTTARAALATSRASRSAERSVSAPDVLDSPCPLASNATRRTLASSRGARCSIVVAQLKAVYAQPCANRTTVSVFRDTRGGSSFERVSPNDGLRSPPRRAYTRNTSFPDVSAETSTFSSKYACHATGSSAAATAREADVDASSVERSLASEASDARNRLGSGGGVAVARAVVPKLASRFGCGTPAHGAAVHPGFGSAPTLFRGGGGSMRARASEANDVVLTYKHSRKEPVRATRPSFHPPERDRGSRLAARFHAPHVTLERTRLTSPRVSSGSSRAKSPWGTPGPSSSPRRWRACRR